MKPRNASRYSQIIEKQQLLLCLDWEYCDWASQSFCSSLNSLDHYVSLESQPSDMVCPELQPVVVSNFCVQRRGHAGLQIQIRGLSAET